MATVSSYTFRLKTCDSGRIDLATSWNTQDTSVYSFNIGDDVIISEGGSIEAVNIPGLLSCSEFRDFWVSWNNSGSGYLRLGRGEQVEAEVVAELKILESHSIAALGFSNAGDTEQVVTWDVPKHEGRAIQFRSNPSNLNPHGASWLTLTDQQHYLIFPVRACDAITVSLATYVGHVHSSYVVLIGDSGNTRTSIVRMRDGAVVAEV